MGKKKIKGEIGYCPDSTLGIGGKGGHYVYIKSHDKNTGLCEVNTVTSLERGQGQYLNNRLNQVRKGNTCPIPYHDANFREWSGVTAKSISGVKLSDIQDVGKNKQVSKKQQSIINKFLKK